MLHPRKKNLFLLPQRHNKSQNSLEVQNFHGKDKRLKIFTSNYVVVVFSSAFRFVCAPR
jgi:hypothetical protein